MMEFNGENIIPAGYRHYFLESWSFPGEFHAVDTEEGTCSCMGWQCCGYCRHLEAMQELEKCLSTPSVVSCRPQPG